MVNIHINIIADDLQSFRERLRAFLDGPSPLGGVTVPAKPESTPVEPKPAPKQADSADVLPRKATEATRKWFLDQVQAAKLGASLLAYAHAKGILLPNEGVGDWPLAEVPTSKGALSFLFQEVAAWEKTQDVMPEDEPAPGAAVLEPECFKTIIPVPHSGQKRDDYLKKPDTIGSLYWAMKNGDQEAQSRLWGFVENFEVKTNWTDGEGKVHERAQTQIDQDDYFRSQLDAFRKWHDEKDHAVTP